MEKISGKLCFEELPLDQQFDHPTSENFNHRLEASKGDIEKCPLVIKATLQALAKSMTKANLAEGPEVL